MADTRLSAQTQKTLQAFAHAFDGYAYAAHRWPTRESQGQSLLAQFTTTSKLPTALADCFALNFLLHRNFHGHGTLPPAYSDGWRAMVLLFLHLYHHPLPADWSHPELARSWSSRPAGSDESAAAEIRQHLGFPPQSS